MISLRAARPNEAMLLTALCLRSKAVWGYDEAFMRACRQELTLTAGVIESSCVQVAELNGTVIGMVQVAVEGTTAQLDKLFVEPSNLRCGAGGALFVWAKTAARQAGARILTIDADPGAAGFYRRMGAVEDGVSPSGSIAGRFLPRLKLAL